MRGLHAQAGQPRRSPPENETLTPSFCLVLHVVLQIDLHEHHVLAQPFVRGAGQRPLLVARLNGFQLKPQSLALDVHGFVRSAGQHGDGRACGAVNGLHEALVFQ